MVISQFYYSWRLKIVITLIAIEIFLHAFLIYFSAYLWSAIEETDDATDHFLFARANLKCRVATWYEERKTRNGMVE